MKLKLERFRGFETLDFLPEANVFLIGEPRAGRTSVLAALRKVLDAGSTRVRPSPWDVHRPLADVGDNEDYPLTSVEASIVGLGDDIEQELDDRIELLDPISGEPQVAGGTSTVLGLRLRYCLKYNPIDESLEHWVEYSKSQSRVPRKDRELLGAIIIDHTAPLQLRSEGAFRALAASQDVERLNDTLSTFTDSVKAATDELTASDTITDALKAMTGWGAAHSLGVTAKTFQEGVGFGAEDGSISGLLRAIQPTLELDDAGALPLVSHGSTAPTILAITEAIAAARISGQILIIDDFGDSLDSASADFLARLLRGKKNQLWLATRRAEAFGGFEPGEIARVSQRNGVPQVNQLTKNPDRQERARRRYLSQILSSAMSARTVILTEGPHDLEGYGAVDNRLLSDARKLPLSSRGAQIVPASATGADGGKTRLPGLAGLARELGFAVRVVLDHDKPGEDNVLIEELRTVCDLVVHLPPRVAVERALVLGLPSRDLRQALTILNDDFQLGLDLSKIEDSNLEKKAASALKQKGGLHESFVNALPKGVVPPIARQVIEALKGAAPSDPLIELTAP